MSFRGRDGADVGNPNKMEYNEPRRFGGAGADDKPMGDDPDDRRFDSSRGRRQPFGRGRRPSPSGRDRPREYGFGRDEPSLMRDRSPLRGPEDRFSDRYKKDDSNFPKRDDLGRKDLGGSFYGDDPPRDRYMEGRSRMDGPGSFNSRFDAPADPYRSRSINYPGAAPPPPKPFFNEGFPKPNECEIIAVNKHQRAYAESVEARIKEMGILVDVLFLKDEALLTQTIDDIARRGSLYAMVISPQNETHGSVTVNILHGTPQEHRNMPLEDALKLVARNFHEHVRMQKENMERERAERGPYNGGVPADREIQFLLRMLADGRWISTAEISAVIRYLSERRDKMQGGAGEDRVLGREPMLPSSDIKHDIPFKPKEDIDVAQKEQDLQNRIMNIMNQGAPPQSGNSQGGNSMLPNTDTSNTRPNQPRMSPGMNNMRPQSGMGSNLTGIKPPAPDSLINQQGLESNPARGESVNQPVFTSTTAGANAPSDTASTPTYINFDNPSVQKALDNLIQSGPNLLKNISMSTSSLSAPPQGSLSSPGNVPKPNVSGVGLGPPNEPMGMQRNNMGPPRGPGGMSDMPGSGPSRGPSNLDMGPPRGASGGMSDMGGPGPQRGPGSSDSMGQQRRGFGGMSDMGGMGSMRGYNSGGISDSNMGQPRMSDSGRMGGPPHNMGPGGNYPGQNQFGKYQGPGQQGNFPGSSFNSSNMGNMPRQNYGGGQGMGGMGGAPRRY